MNSSSRNRSRSRSRSRVVFLRLARSQTPPILRLKGVDKFTPITFEMVRAGALRSRERT